MHRLAGALARSSAGISRQISLREADFAFTTFKITCFAPAVDFLGVPAAMDYGLSHAISESDLVEGDHIYAWREALVYSHQGKLAQVCLSAFSMSVAPIPHAQLGNRQIALNPCRCLRLVHIMPTCHALLAVELAEVHAADFRSAESCSVG